MADLPQRTTDGIQGKAMRSGRVGRTKGCRDKVGLGLPVIGPIPAHGMPSLNVVDQSGSACQALEYA